MAVRSPRKLFKTSPATSLLTCNNALHRLVFAYNRIKNSVNLNGRILQHDDTPKSNHRNIVSIAHRSSNTTRQQMMKMTGDSFHISSTRIHPTIQSMRSLRKSLDWNSSVGFVPTMGALHDGHLSLARAARSQNDVVIASIFVNPTQFSQGEDLDKYPRQLEKDVKLLQEVGVDHVFSPTTDTMYGINHSTVVDPIGFETTREGMARPGHFRGVATIVTKLFNIVQPTNAYFGQKDAAQCALIRRITNDLNMDVNVKIMDTVREENGLAMSSRNAYLTSEEKEKASIIYKSLCAAREVFESRLARGMEDILADDLKDVVESVLRTEPLISEVQYISIDDTETMQPLEKVGNDGCVLSLACILGAVRLIDNIVLQDL